MALRTTASARDVLAGRIASLYCYCTTRRPGREGPVKAKPETAVSGQTTGTAVSARSDRGPRSASFTRPASEVPAPPEVPLFAKSQTVARRVLLPIGQLCG